MLRVCARTVCANTVIGANIYPCKNHQNRESACANTVSVNIAVNRHVAGEQVKIEYLIDFFFFFFYQFITRIPLRPNKPPRLSLEIIDEESGIFMRI